MAQASHPDDHHLSRQLTLRDLVLSQVLTVVGSSWVGLAAGLGHAQTLVWLFSMTVFYLPMAVAVFHLNRELPLEGGLYVWARRAFGDTAGFLTAWNIWAYGLVVIAMLLFQLPSEFAFMIGPAAAWIPDNHLVVLPALATLLIALSIATARGLALGKWIHNLSAIAMMTSFALLILAPFWAYFHHLPIHYTPFELHIPRHDPVSLALIGQTLFASCGLEYIAIMAGESKAPSRDIGRSILIASPIIVLMFTLGTASVLAFHELSGSTINYIAPIPQTLRLAFGDHGFGTFVARFVILLLQLRILGAASFIFTGVARLPMAAGWDHLVPAWFSRLHPRFRTPTNSILVAAVLIAGLIVLGSVGVHASEAFNVLNNASTELYALAYLALFAIPIVGAKWLRNRIPRWVTFLCGVGFLATLFTFCLNAYPFDNAAAPIAFAAKILGATLLVNVVGYAFYRLRRPVTAVTANLNPHPNSSSLVYPSAMSLNAQNTPGQLPSPDTLVNIPRLVAAYYAGHPDASIPAQRVAFGTSGHRGSAFNTAFNDDHIAAITQAIVEYRAGQGTTGPLFLAQDTHALSEPAFTTALEVLAANNVETFIDQDLGYTPTPALSHAILTYNAAHAPAGAGKPQADGIIITPSHNPPEDGGFKYNPPNGGPADTTATKWIENRANDLIAAKLEGVKRVSFARALNASTTHRHDFITAYCTDLANVIDFGALKGTTLKLAVDPLGGAGVHYWPRIAEMYNLPVEILNPYVDPTFRFMTLDWDSRIRMDCSSPNAMASMIRNKDKFDVAWGCDTDHDRHGIVTATTGLLNPNHYLAVCIQYLFTHRPEWSAKVGIGKTLVSSSIIDRVAKGLNRPMLEVPVGFKWFVDGLIDGSLGFVGEESAGATFLRSNGQVWTTDKDGLILGLLAAEMTAVTGKDPGLLYNDLTAKYGNPVYQRIDAAATKDEKAKLAKLSPSQVTAKTLAGEPITAILTEAPGNHAAIGGLKVTTENGWFAARPSGTEDVYKIYAESFNGLDHLKQIQEEAKALVSAAFAG